MNISKIALLATLALTACAGADKKLDTKVAQESQVKNNRDLRTEADSLIQNDDQLSPDQKAKLTALRQSISSQTSALNKQELRLRSVLTEELLSPDYSIDEVALIKKRLKKLSSRRLSLLFDGINQGNEIMGKTYKNRSPVMRAMMEQRIDSNRD
jgi:hypothetical protein